MSENHTVALDVEIAKIVQNEKKLKETWSECIGRIFEEVKTLRREFVR